MSAEVRLALTSVSKRYPSGDGLSDLSLQVHAGEVHAIVGMNGAGKSTTMRVALQMTDHDDGRVRLFGRPITEVGPGEWRRVGHSIEDTASYPELTVAQNLAIAARLHGLPPRTVARTQGDPIDEVVTELGLTRYRDRRVRELSHGNRQRERIAAALVHTPDLVLLDEPTSTLDPAGVLLVRHLIQQRARAGAGVLVSSHHLDEVARIADTITVINRGRAIGQLVAAGADLERAFFALVRADSEGDE